MDLTGATVLVTGASRGIGLALCERLAEEPIARLLVGVRDPARAPEVRATSGGAARVEPVRIDLSSRASIEDGIASWPVPADGIDVLVNNAGVLTGGPLPEQELDDIYAALQVNLAGLVHLTRAVLPGMLARGRGQVVNNASVSGFLSFPGASTYAASKAGVVAFSESLRREVGASGVEVVLLATARVETDMAARMDDLYASQADTGGFRGVTPAQWADRVVRGMRDGDGVVWPGGAAGAMSRLLRGPEFVVDLAARQMRRRAARS